MGRFKLIILFLMSAFCLVGNAQIRMSETVEIAKDRRIAEHKVLGVLWDTPSLWYSPSDTFICILVCQMIVHQEELMLL